MSEKHFPNGFTSWIETFYEVVAFITCQVNDPNESKNVIQQTYSSHGTGGLYNLAESWTDQFEKENENREWDGDFFDKIETFLKANKLTGIH